MPSSGGSSIWIEGPDNLDARCLAERAEVFGVLLEPGDIYFDQEPPPRNHFRLGFSSIDKGAIRAGISILAGLV